MLETFRIVAINGPRQSGKQPCKSELPRQRICNIILLIIPILLMPLPMTLSALPIVPEIIPPIKMNVDEHNRKGMFLLTGSSDMFKNSKIKESLAGRMVSFNLFPLSHAEINNRDIKYH